MRIYCWISSDERLSSKQTSANVQKENLESIEIARKKGIKIVLATAREYSSTKYISKLIDCDYGVFSNGSHLLDLSKLETLSPLLTIKRGYTITKKNGKVITSTKDLKVKDKIELTLTDGTVNAEII